jgi:NADH-quinone oxidoreductase subunit D
MLEMSRISAHLFIAGGTSATTGQYSNMFWGIADRDRILDLFEELTGARIYNMFITPGGVRRDIPEGFLDRLGQVLDFLEARLPEYDDLFFDNPVFHRRAEGIGKMNQEQALAWGVTGPNLRACGLPFDVRRNDPYLVYEQLDFDIPTETGGDVLDRIRVRRSEIIESTKILRQVIERIPHVKGPICCHLPNPLAWNVPEGEVYTRTEAQKGELAFYAVSTGGTKPWRVHVRGPSCMHAVQVLEKLCLGSRIEDIAMIMFSLDACPPEVDR